MTRAPTLLSVTLAVLLSGIAVFVAGVPVARAEGPAPAGKPAWNPYLASWAFAVQRVDSAQTSAFVASVSRGTFHPDVRGAARIRGGPVNIMTFASPSPRSLWAVSSLRVVYIELNLAQFTEIAGLDTGPAKGLAPDRLDALLRQPFATLPELEEGLRREWGADDRTWPELTEGTTCGVVDIENVLYVNAGRGGATLLAIGLVDSKRPQAGLKVLRRVDLSGVLKPAADAPGPAIVGLNMTYDGRLVVVGRRSLAVLERSLVGERRVVPFGDDETVWTGAAVDERGGIYVASDRIMRKLVWNHDRLSAAEPDGAWAAPYDTGGRQPTVKPGIGTGATPALMGFGGDPDKLVVITDGADRMKLVAFWRDKIPNWFRQRPYAKSLRVAGLIHPTFGLPPEPGLFQSGQSVVVDGYGAFVVNGVRSQGSTNRLVDTLGAGPIFDLPAGAERFEWNPADRLWRSVWTRPDVVSTTMAPAMSNSSGIVLVHGYTKKDGWEVTGLDWKTGQTVHRTILGKDPMGNGGFGALHFLEEKDLVFESVAGPIRLQLDIQKPARRP
jgi:hypothetical protein